MSMNVDLTKPLSAEAYAYLQMRGNQADLERVAALTGGQPPEGFSDDGDGTGPQMEPVMQGEVRAARKERLLAELQAIEAAEESEPGEEEPGEEEPGEDEPYATWTVPQLDKELKARELPVTGNKPEKVARLEEDDRLNAES